LHGVRKFNDVAVRLGLEALYFSQVYRVLEPVASGRGVIFMLHRVRTAPSQGGFAPNAGLEITPEYLSDVLSLLKQRDIDIITLDEVSARLADDRGKRFAVFTFDDGYADNLDVALPVFEAFDAPFTIYVTTGFIDGVADFWWMVLEHAIEQLDELRMEIGEHKIAQPTKTPEQKQSAWDAIYWLLRDLSITERHELVAGLARQAGVKEGNIQPNNAMTWQQVRDAARHRLITIGAHTIHHYPTAALSAEDALHEIQESRCRLEAELDAPVRHFAYPFGDSHSAGARDFLLARDCGFSTAVTTRRGPLFSDHGAHLHCLPRVTLNGNYQHRRFTKLFLTGAPFMLWNRARKLDVA
jgi:peptidoglycan/xylan/chitin deacetylase (PgdA/CDA1 family)